MKKTQQILLGLILIVIGGLIGLSALGAIDFNIFFNGWWTLFIIIPCFLALFGEGADRVWDLIGIGIGVVLMLACLGVIDFKLIWGLVLPVVLMIVGLVVVGKGITTRRATPRMREIRKDARPQRTLYAIFSTEKTSYTHKNFAGCNTTALFGRVDLDLRQADIQQDVVVTARAMFGNVKIRLPKDVNLEVNSTAFFGETNDDFSKEETGKGGEGKPTVHLNSLGLFGGVRVQ